MNKFDYDLSSLEDFSGGIFITYNMEQTSDKLPKPPKELLRNNPPPNSTPEQLKSWYKHIEPMEEQKPNGGIGKAISGIISLGILIYVIYLLAQTL